MSSHNTPKKKSSRRLGLARGRRRRDYGRERRRRRGVGRDRRELRRGRARRCRPRRRGGALLRQTQAKTRTGPMRRGGPRARWWRRGGPWCYRWAVGELELASARRVVGLNSWPFVRFPRNTCSRAAARLLSLNSRWNEYVTKVYRVRIALCRAYTSRWPSWSEVCTASRPCLIVTYPCRQRRLSTPSGGWQGVRRQRLAVKHSSIHRDRVTARDTRRLVSLLALLVCSRSAS